MTTDNKQSVLVEITQEICHCLLLKDFTGFFEAANRLKKEYPMADQAIIKYQQNIAYHLHSQYPIVLAEGINALKNEDILRIFIGELLLPPAIARKLLEITTGMDELILESMQLDKFMHKVLYAKMMQDCDYRPVYCIDESIRALKLIAKKNTTGSLFEQGVLQLLSNQYLSKSNLKSNDVIDLCDYQKTITSESESHLASQVSKLDHVLAKTSDIRKEYDKSINEAIVLKTIGKFQDVEPIKIRQVRQMLQMDLISYAKSEISRCGLELKLYADSEELMNTIPSLTKMEIRESFSRVLSSITKGNKNLNIKPYFLISHRHDIDPPAPQFNELNIYLSEFSAYLERIDCPNDSLGWAAEFFDKSISHFSNVEIGKLNIAGKIPHYISERSSRLKRFSLENDFGI